MDKQRALKFAAVEHLLEAQKLAGQCVRDILAEDLGGPTIVRGAMNAVAAKVDEARRLYNASLTMEA